MLEFYSNRNPKQTTEKVPEDDEVHVCFVHVVVLLKIRLDNLVKLIDRLDFLVDAFIRLAIRHQVVTEQQVTQTILVKLTGNHTPHTERFS